MRVVACGTGIPSARSKQAAACFLVKLGNEEIWPQPSVYGKKEPDMSQRIGFSDFTTSGRVNYKDVVDEIYDEINKQYGTNIKALY